MNDTIEKLKKLSFDLNKAKDFFFKHLKTLESSVHIYTHLDADGLTSGAILGKALYRAGIPFQITVLRQLEKEEIEKIAKKVKEFHNFIIFSDFGSGQYKELQKKFFINDHLAPFIILDHHIPQNISNKEKRELLEDLHKKTNPWHINPYFYDIDGSNEISGAGLCYYFVKCLNKSNIDLSPLAIIGAIGDIQNKGPNKSFKGINSLILEEAKNSGLIEVIDDLNFSSIKPLNEAIAYSSEIKLPGLSKDPNKTLKFLQTLGIFMENSEGNIRTLSDLNQDEKQKITSAIIEYSSLKLDIEPSKIVEKLIVNRYSLKNELFGSILHDANDFSYLLNSCGRTENSSLGIAIAMGDRKVAFQKAQEILKDHKRSIMKSLSWIQENQKIQKKENIQFFFGEDVIPESIIGTISSMLIFDAIGQVDKLKPIFGCVKRVDEEVYKISGRAHEFIVNKGVNLSEAIRKASEISNIESLGGGHPPAAGTKIPIEKIDIFLENIDKVIKEQLQKI